MKIEILGPGCYRCIATKDNVRKALESLILHAEIVHISDPREVARRGVMFTPAVIIDGQLNGSKALPTGQAG